MNTSPAVPATPDPLNQPFRVELRAKRGRDLCVYGFDTRDAAADHFKTIVAHPNPLWTSVRLRALAGDVLQFKRFPSADKRHAYAVAVFQHNAHGMTRAFLEQTAASQRTAASLPHHDLIRAAARAELERRVAAVADAERAASAATRALEDAYKRDGADDDDDFVKLSWERVREAGETLRIRRAQNS